MDTKKIVILGGGYAGIEAAKVLNKRFKKNDKVEITLVDKNTYHTLMTELHEVAGSRVEPDSVMISYPRIFSGTKVNVVTDYITGIDFEKQRLKSEKTEYEYDYLVLGTGGAPEFFDTEGVQENSFSLWSLEDALRLREHFEERFRLAAKEPDAALKKKMLTFVVAGAGFTGIELIGEFLERRDVLCEKYHIPVSDVRMIVVEALDTVLPIIEDKLREKAVSYLKKKGTEIILGARIIGAEEGKVLLGDGSSIETDTFVWTCGIHGSEFTARVNLTMGRTARGKCSMASAEGIHGMCGCRFEEDERHIVGTRGRILVNEYMQTVDYSNVYAVGDNLWFVENEKVLPQIVETAMQTGSAAAVNIIADIQQSDKTPFKSNYHGFMVSIGGKYAVSNAGGMKTSGFMATAMKHIVNLHYLFGIAGINAFWGYMKHEFFDMKDRRTFLGEHFSWKIQGWWAFPLRVWLGIMWLAEGLNKIGEGWLNFASGTKSGWMFSPGVIQKGVQTVSDAVSAASGETEAATQAVTAASGAVAEQAAEAVSAASGAVAEHATEAVSAASGAAQQAVEAVSAASGAVADTATNAIHAAGSAFGKIWDTSNVIIQYDSGFVTWFRHTFMDSIMAYVNFPVFQTMIVLMELCIGLALIGGCFTWLASAASIVMCAVFAFSGMFSWDQAWFVFAAFLMLGGAGRSLGIDHWLMPAWKRHWNSTKFAKKTYFYVGEPRLKRKK